MKNGRLIYQNLRRELITEDEFMSQLRQQGVESLAAVKAAYIEPDGSISIIPHPAIVTAQNSKPSETTQKLET